MLEKEMDKYSEMGFSDMGVFWGVHMVPRACPPLETDQTTCTLSTGPNVHPPDWPERAPPD